MNMELVKVETNGVKQTVLGRDLHEFLEVETQYKDWFPRMVAYGFEKGLDYFELAQKRAGSEGGRIVTRDILNHQLTLDMAKEISMIQRTPKGKQARQYFIECEKQLMEELKRDKDIPSYQIEDKVKRAQKWIEEFSCIIDLEKKVDELKPQAEGYKKLVDAGGLLKIGQVAKTFNINPQKLFSILREHNVLMDNNEPYKKYMTQQSDYFRTKIWQVRQTGKVSIVPLVTSKGVDFIYRLLRNKGYITYT